MIIAIISLILYDGLLTLMIRMVSRCLWFELFKLFNIIESELMAGVNFIALFSTK